MLFVMCENHSRCCCNISLRSDWWLRWHAGTIRCAECHHWAYRQPWSRAPSSPVSTVNRETWSRSLDLQINTKLITENYKKRHKMRQAASTNSVSFLSAYQPVFIAWIFNALGLCKSSSLSLPLLQGTTQQCDVLWRCNPSTENSFLHESGPQCQFFLHR